MFGVISLVQSIWDRTISGVNELNHMSVSSAHESEGELSASERELLKELALAVRGIRYGSVVLTIHEGRIVEMSKTERVRRSPA
jgi:hypothetical protein